MGDEVEFETDMSADAAKAYRSFQLWSTVRHITAGIGFLLFCIIVADCQGGIDIAALIHGK
jgi:hypothetical protein